MKAHDFACQQCTMAIRVAFSDAIGDNDRKIVLRHIRCVFTDHQDDTGHTWTMQVRA